MLVSMLQKATCGGVGEATVVCDRHINYKKIHCNENQRNMFACANGNSFCDVKSLVISSFHFAFNRELDFNRLEKFLMSREAFENPGKTYECAQTHNFAFFQNIQTSLIRKIFYA